MYKRNSFCSYCGHAFVAGTAWPRLCDSCGNTSFINPVPVAVVLIPVDNGVLGIRRAIEPRKGQLALPGGFIDFGESWQAAGAREVLEETGLTVDRGSLREVRVLSAPEGVVLIFGLAPRLPRSVLTGFTPTNETSELVLLDHSSELAFPLHQLVVAEFFEGKFPTSIG